MEFFFAYVPCEGEKSSYIYWVNKIGWNAKETYGGHVQKFKHKEIEKYLSDNELKILKEYNGEHYIYQIADFLFFTLLSLSGKNLKSSIEAVVYLNKPSYKYRTLSLLVKLVALLSAFESTILKHFPGSGIFVVATKQ